MQPKIHALACEGDAFQFEAEALFERGIETEFDGSARAYYALPRQRVGWIMAQEARDGAVIERVSGRCGDLPVAGDFALGDGANDAAERLVAHFVGAKSFTLERAPQRARGQRRLA